MFVANAYTGADGEILRYGELLNSRQPSSGKALLFIPGLGGSIKSALEFLEALLPVHSPIYGPDLRGFGLNPLQDPLHQADIILKDLDAFYRQVVEPVQHQDVTLCGLSLGGVFATLLAARYPERFSRLVLFAPAYKPHARSFSLSYTIRNILAHLILGKKARTQLPYGLADITSNPRILEDPQYNILEPLILTPGFLLSVRNLCLQAMREAANIKIPTLMVIPGQDTVCDPAAMRQAFDRIPANTPKKCLHYADFYHDVLMESGHTAIVEEMFQWTGQSESYSATSS
jgi:alpha-beta hydrolase superfamily lysophospholipase